jgi:hypothetical protein
MASKGSDVRAFHRHPADENEEQLLDPERQFSTPWGDDGKGPCEKCDGEGNVEHHCFSCLASGEAISACPACQGRVRWIDTCPSCEGTGEITRVKRSGVSSFPTAEGLRRYLAERGEDLTGDVFLEMEGELSPDRDLDADEGAILLFPRRIVARHEVDEASQG